MSARTHTRIFTPAQWKQPLREQEPDMIVSCQLFPSFPKRTLNIKLMSAPRMPAIVQTSPRHPFVRDLIRRKHSLLPGQATIIRARSQTPKQLGRND